MRLPSLPRGSDAISPTAHYTGEVWMRNGLSHPELGTWEGRVFFDALTPLMTARRALGQPTLEGSLLARHRVIGELLDDAVAGGVTQVIELACGMSPLGWRLCDRYGDLVYVETDLPEMAARKRRALSRIGGAGDRHRVLEVDALLDSGPGSLAQVAETLDPEQGLAIVTEGLVMYYGDEEVLGMLRRFAEILGRFREGRYIADIRIGGIDYGIAERAFGVLLSAFVRGRVYTHFDGEADTVRALRAAGFDRARLLRGDWHRSASERHDPGAALVRVLDASLT